MPSSVENSTPSLSEFPTVPSSADGKFPQSSGGGTSDYAFLGGGLENTIFNGKGSVIGGGYMNVVNGGDMATIGGGSQNNAFATRSTISGGHYNRAKGDYSTVPGGRFNKANGKDSFAVGNSAQADNDSAAVFSFRTPRTSTTDADPMCESVAENTVTMCTDAVHFLTDTVLIRDVNVGQSIADLETEVMTLNTTNAALTTQVAALEATNAALKSVLAAMSPAIAQDDTECDGIFYCKLLDQTGCDVAAGTISSLNKMNGGVVFDTSVGCTWSSSDGATTKNICGVCP
eukprot:CAMPEP_0194028722 /NCGR_PEP_ID=MMETSP0009_2-20130614/2629_1 /TAXON_ID=210454 /ORGANISM="Grammatophora oceanica, Strain CCMP 410" /LENGTH=287 /DNA_ID=CAMNT_0038668195 /DNA_START=827 /DNA_END=1691 /DNA_ORIENTATION=-